VARQLTPSSRRMASPRACQHPNRTQLDFLPNRRYWAQARTTWLEAAASYRLSPRTDPLPIHPARAGGPGGRLPQQTARSNPVFPGRRWWILNNPAPSTLTPLPPTKESVAARADRRLPRQPSHLGLLTADTPPALRSLIPPNTGGSPASRT
jgi:hypothetical protein